MSNEQTYWANAYAVLVTETIPPASTEGCATPIPACRKPKYEGVLPLFAAVEALKGEDGTSPTSIEIKDGVLHITLSDGSVLTTDGSKLVTADYVDNAVKPYICSFTERDLWRVMNGASFTLSQEDTEAICFSPKGVRVLFRDDFGLLSGTVLSCGHYYSDILILLIGEHIYNMSTIMTKDSRLVMTSGNSVNITNLATQKDVDTVSREVEKVKEEVQFMTQAEYDALEQYRDDVLYVITE